MDNKDHAHSERDTERDGESQRERKRQRQTCLKKPAPSWKTRKPQTSTVRPLKISLEIQYTIVMYTCIRTAAIIANLGPAATTVNVDVIEL